MKKFWMAALATTTVMGAHAAHAQYNAQGNMAWPHWYVGLTAAMPFVENTDLEQRGAADLGEMDFDTGVGGGVSLGYRPTAFASDVGQARFELEYTMRKNDFNTLAGAPIGSDITSNSFMANVFYDFKAGSFMPYIGAGAGMSRVEFGDERDSVFAYQGMAGIGYTHPLVPNTVFTLGYRYFVTDDPEYNTGVVASPLTHEYTVQNAEIGARFNF